MDRKLLSEILKLTKNKEILIIKELEEYFPKERIEHFLSYLKTEGIAFQPTIDGNYSITREQRAQLAIIGAVNGLDFIEVIDGLSWQEFEILTTKVGDEFGYQAKKGLVFSDSERKYQIDVILSKNPYVLVVDCKHYGGTGKKAVLKTAAEEQKIRAQAFANSFTELQELIGLQKQPHMKIIPLVITWLDESLFFHDKVPIVPFGRLRGFFRNFYLYVEDIEQIKINSQ
jgi:hypothetical protein